MGEIKDLPKGITKDDINAILGASLKYSASHIQELADNSMLSKVKTLKIISYLVKKKKLNEEVIGFDYINSKVMARVPEFSNIGTAGYGNMSRKKWFSNPERVKYLEGQFDFEKARKELKETEELMEGLL